MARKKTPTAPSDETSSRTPKPTAESGDAAAPKKKSSATKAALTARRKKAVASEADEAQAMAQEADPIAESASAPSSTSDADADASSASMRARPKLARSVRTIRRAPGAERASGGRDSQEGGERQRLVIDDDHADAGPGEGGLLGAASGMLHKNITGPRSPKYSDLAQVCRKLSSLLRSGIALVPSLRILADRQGSNRNLAAACGDVARAVERGSSFADALAHHPAIFDTLFVGTVRAGETAGIMEEALARLAEVYAQRAHLRRRLVRASIYPIILVAVAAVVIAIIMVWVVPVFSEAYANSDQQLPLSTRMIIAVSNHLQATWMLWFSVVALAILGFRWLLRTRDDARIAWERLKLRVPQLGTLHRLVNSEHVAQTMGNLLGAGIPLWETLKLTSQTSESLLVEECLEEACNAVETGKKLEPTLRKSPAFMRELSDIVGIGEETGMLERLLTQLSDSYEDEIRNRVDIVLDVANYVILSAMVTIVVIILISVYQPYFNLMNTIGE